MTFDNDSDFENFFETPRSGTPNLDNIRRDPAGFLKMVSNGQPVGYALFDSGATGGSSGSSGTSGSGINNDLTDFKISGIFSTTGADQVGFLLRLNDAAVNKYADPEATGYCANITFPSPSQVKFSLCEGANTAIFGYEIFSETLSPPGFLWSANTFYSFSVTADGGSFTFDFSDGLATTTFTDPTPTALTGQVGIVLTAYKTSGRYDSVNFDNFSIQAIPEPHPIFLGAVAFLTITLAGKFGSKTGRSASTPS